MRSADNPAGPHAGTVVNLPGLGRVSLVQAIARSPETALYRSDHEGVGVKVFDLECGKPDEVSYGAQVNFQAELATFEEIEASEALRPFVPRYYGAGIDYEQKYAFIAMEFLPGQNLRAWAEEAAVGGFERESLQELYEAVVETLSILDRFHRHGLIVIDFKPDNVLRLPDGSVRFVDLGAFFTPRHVRDLRSFVYAATPDHAEVSIDASNLQAGVAPSVASDVFSAGVALFEMATGTSRLVIDPAAAEDMLATPSLYRFRDSQITDIWRAFPHLKDALPLVQSQLRERHLLFSELWHLLKAFVTARVPDWESMPEEQHGQILLSTGTSFIRDQLPAPLTWLAGAIARATVLRSLRLKNVSEVIALLGDPVPGEVPPDLAAHNCLVKQLLNLGLSTDFTSRLNTWAVRQDPVSNHWTIAGPVACRELGDNAAFVFLKRNHTDDDGHTYWHTVDEFEADVIDGNRASLALLKDDHRAWLGTASGTSSG